MRIVEINSTLNGSTGKIARQIAETASATGHKMTLCVPKWRKSEKIDTNYDTLLFGSPLSQRTHQILSRLTGYNGVFSYFATKRLIKKLQKISPDIIHMHNLHTYYINQGLLFKYIKQNNIKCIWTLHDCWSFTGQCPYFVLANCDKWKTGCHHCPQYKNGYSPTIRDGTKKMYALKKKWFTDVKDMTIVTPSVWLGGLVKQSYLKDYPIKVINNGIDLSIFKPTESNFVEKHGLQGKYIVLGVSFGWNFKKGLDVFIELSKILDDSFKIVLVGTNDAVDKALPDNIISIHRTYNQSELAEIYSAAHVFANPTREENYPTVNMEAIACGTPVVTFNTGGSPEIPDEKSGCVVDVNDIDEFQRQIQRVCIEQPFSKDDCLERAKYFDASERFKEYIELYK